MIYARQQIKALMREPQAFAEFCSGLKLRKYQQGVMDAIVDSVLNERGFSFVVMFPRQTGKNELQAHLEVYLLTLFSQYSVELIKVSPTLDPQGQISMQRFEKVLKQNTLVRRQWKKEGDNVYRMHGARMTFLSAATGSNIVGATASGLLEVDEAQQVSIQKFDRDVSPMAASTCATHVFWGTAWTKNTLLGRELRAAQEAEKMDGIRRVFKLSAENIYPEVPEYRKFVEDKVARQGRNHPLIRSQYFSEEIDSAGAMFPAERMEKMRPRKWAGANRVGASPTPTSGITAMLLDVAGEDEGVRTMTGEMSLANPARDATALTLVEIVFHEETVGLVSRKEKPSARDGDTQANSSSGSEWPTLREMDKHAEIEVNDEEREAVGLVSRKAKPSASNGDTQGNCSSGSKWPTLRENITEMVGRPSHFSDDQNDAGELANKMDDVSGRPTLREMNGHPTPQENDGRATLQKYRVVRRWQWVGVKHTELHERIRAIALEWKARAVVVDATGVGAGLASFLDRALPGKVTQFTFNHKSKSDLGWRFLEVVDSGRWQEPVFEDLPGDDQLRFQKEFYTQLAACQFEVSNDSKQSMRWGVPEGSRDPVSGEALHDDWVLSAALCAELEEQNWSLPSSPLLIQGIDPLEEMDGGF